MSIIGGTNGFIENDNKYMLLAFTNEEIATDEQCKAWWDGFSDINAIDGLGEGLRVVVGIDQRIGQVPYWKYMVVFGFSGDVEQLKNAVAGHESTADSALWFYEAIGDTVQKPWSEQDTEEHIFMALTNVKPGRLAEFTEWYDVEHVPDVVSVRCYRSGRRFHLEASSGNSPWEFLAIYRFVGPAIEMHEILTEDLDKLEKGDAIVTDALVDDDGGWIYSAV